MAAGPGAEAELGVFHHHPQPPLTEKQLKRQLVLARQSANSTVHIAVAPATGIPVPVYQPMTPGHLCVAKEQCPGREQCQVLDLAVLPTATTTNSLSGTSRTIQNGEELFEEEEQYRILVK